jgi:hypothetical protein
MFAVGIHADNSIMVGAIAGALAFFNVNSTASIRKAHPTHMIIVNYSVQNRAIPLFAVREELLQGHRASRLGPIPKRISNTGNFNM